MKHSSHVLTYIAHVYANIYDIYLWHVCMYVAWVTIWLLRNLGPPLGGLPKFLLHNTRVLYTSSLTSLAAINAQNNFQGLIWGGYIYTNINPRRYAPGSPVNLDDVFALSIFLSACLSIFSLACSSFYMYSFSQVLKYQSALCSVCSHFIRRPQLQCCSSYNLELSPSSSFLSA